MEMIQLGLMRERKRIQNELDKEANHKQLEPILMDYYSVVKKIMAQIKIKVDNLDLGKGLDEADIDSLKENILWEYLERHQSRLGKK